MAYQGLMLKTGIESYSPNHLDLLPWASENHLLISSEHSASIKNVGDTLEAFIANRLIPLNKNPGIRPIGVGEVIRLFGSGVAEKVIMDRAKKDVQQAVGSLQVCLGQDAGAEAIRHPRNVQFIPARQN